MAREELKMTEREILMMNMNGKWEQLSEVELTGKMRGDFYGACCECPIKINGVERTADEWQKTGQWRKS
jgi:RNA polymerase-binding transcription factor DksA